MQLNSRDKKSFQLAAHIFVWLALFSVPFLLFSKDLLAFDFVFKRYILPIIFAGIIFYINYFLLINKYYFNKKVLLFVLLNIVIIFIFVMIDYAIEDFMPKHQPPPNFMHYPNLAPHHQGPKLFSPRIMFIYTAIIINILPVVLSLALKVGQKLLKVERINRELDNKQLETQLLQLKYQLQPHFFFNSLNNIYSLVDSSPEKAKVAIHSLGKLMRYLLYETESKKVSLRQEVEFLKKYIQLMQLRLTNKTQTSITLAEDIENYYITPLLFMPLVENAFKFGVTALKPSLILIEMKIEKNKLYFRTENAYQENLKSNEVKTGIGLENLKTRLELIYPDKHLFTQDIKNDIFITQLAIEL